MEIMHFETTVYSAGLAKTCRGITLHPGGETISACARDGKKSLDPGSGSGMDS